jgi:hypothetical protein
VVTLAAFDNGLLDVFGSVLRIVLVVLILTGMVGFAGGLWLAWDSWAARRDARMVYCDCRRTRFAWAIPYIDAVDGIRHGHAICIPIRESISESEEWDG